MPSTIPYSPSLTLGSVITPSVMEALTKISHAQAPIDAAQENLSSLISLRRSLDMTRQELVDMRISPAELDASLIKVNADIDAAASHYAAVRMTQEDALLELRTGMPPVMASPESPVDFNHERTQIKQVAIGADNLKLEVQYFSFNENAQDARNQLNKVRGFITATASTAGSDANGASLELANAATEQISQQISTHNIAGTLVIAASCTHRNASMLAPLYLDVDKATLLTFNIATPPLMAAFLANVVHESAQLRRLEENLDYTAERLATVWPHRFHLAEDDPESGRRSADRFAHHPELIANAVYSGRLSLAKVQFALWFFAIFIAFLVIWLTTGRIDSLNSSVVAILGISSGTALGESFLRNPSGTADACRTERPVDQSGPPPRLWDHLKDLACDVHDCLAVHGQLLRCRRSSRPAGHRARHSLGAEHQPGADAAIRPSLAMPAQRAPSGTGRARGRRRLGGPHARRPLLAGGAPGPPPLDLASSSVALDAHQWQWRRGVQPPDR
ncbi:hypothetical protein [Hydrogenophaga sp.]|uniref:hypothetical protein n=1 Tax=Hydrogenophaga sp. TaxID=1904254 RepID=UPI0039194F53